MRSCGTYIGKIPDIWAATWQNQQSDCAPSEGSDQPGHPQSLIRVFAVCLMGSYGPKLPSCGQRRLVRLGGCQDWSESSLGSHSFCWFCHVAAHISRTNCGHTETLNTTMEIMSYINEPRHDKTNKISVRPAKTQISLDIRPVWSVSSLSTWRNLGSLATHWAHSKDSDQTGRMPRMIWVFAGRTLSLLVLSCRGSYCVPNHYAIL